MVKPISYPTSLTLLVSACAAAILAYIPGLSGPFLLDDFNNLETIKIVDMAPASYAQEAIRNHSGPLGRPVSMLSFVAGYQVHGWSPFGFKVTNLAIHVICAFLVFFLATTLARQADYKNPQFFGLAAAALWLTSPLFLSTTLYVVQRMAQLATLFSLLGCFFWAVSLEATRRTAKYTLRAATLLICAPLALFSKENAAVLPLLLVLIHVFLNRPLRDRYSREIRYVLYLAPLPILFFALFPSFLPWDYDTRAFTASERLLTQARVLVDYISNLLIPNPFGLGVYHDDFSISRGVFTPPTTFASILIILALYVSAVQTYIRGNLFGFGLLFFFLAHSIESTIIPLELYFEHRNYLPGVGFFVAVTAALYALARLAPSLRRLLISAVVIAVALNTFILYNRSQVWANSSLLLATAYNEHPESPRVLAQVSIRLAENGRLRKALEILKKISTGDPTTQFRLPAHRLLLYCLADQSPPSSAWERLRQALMANSLTNTEELKHLSEKLNECPNLDAITLENTLIKWIDKSLAEDKISPNGWKVLIHTAKIAAHNEHFDLAKDFALTARYIGQRNNPGPLMMAIYYAHQAGQAQTARNLLDLLRAENSARESAYVQSIIDFYDDQLTDI